MIFTVTLNPTIDQTLVLERVVAGDTLRVKSSRFDTDGLIQVDEDPVPFDALHERIAIEMEARTQRSVFLRGDGAITYDELMSVMDRLKEGGVEEVGLVVDFPREP